MVPDGDLPIPLYPHAAQKDVVHGGGALSPGEDVPQLWKLQPQVACQTKQPPGLRLLRPQGTMYFITIKKQLPKRVSFQYTSSRLSIRFQVVEDFEVVFFKVFAPQPPVS